MLRTPVYGSRLTTRGSVMKGPASPGQQVSTGSVDRSTSSPAMKTSWHGAFRTVFGWYDAMCASCPSALSLANNPWCGSFTMPSRARVRSVSSSSRSTPSADATRGMVPKALASTGISWPSTFSKSSAGPPDFTIRSMISVISRCALTGVDTRRRSPRPSKKAMYSRRSRNLRDTGTPGARVARLAHCQYGRDGVSRTVGAWDGLKAALGG